MNRIVAIIMHMFPVGSATAGICHYCDNAGVTRQYGYAYDNLNRLTAASYIESGRDYLGDQPDYSTSYRYDLNGNPTKVSRYGMSEQ